nr:MAG TPA: hypothetical protein [Caudoviricetes sp.]
MRRILCRGIKRHKYPPPKWRRDGWDLCHDQ